MTVLTIAIVSYLVVEAAMMNNCLEKEANLRINNLQLMVCETSRTMNVVAVNSLIFLSWFTEETCATCSASCS